MNFQKIEELAQEFQVKLALKDEAPPNVRAKDIKWIDEETRQEIKDNGKNHEYIPHDKSHNPPGAIASEKTWDKAKKAVKKYWKKYDEPWAVVYHVYENMGGKPKKKKKSKKKKSFEQIEMMLQKFAELTES